MYLHTQSFMFVTPVYMQCILPTIRLSDMSLAAMQAMSSGCHAVVASTVSRNKEPDPAHDQHTIFRLYKSKDSKCLVFLSSM